VVKQARETGRKIREVVLANGLMTREQFEELISPEAVCCLGSP
jgi:aspartate ammonia-lyase